MNGESWEQFHERVNNAWEQVRLVALEVGAEASDRHLAVVTHGLVCHSLVARHLRGAPETTDGAPVPIGNTSVSTLDPVSGSDGVWHVTDFASVTHLDASAAERSGSGGKV